MSGFLTARRDTMFSILMTRAAGLLLFPFVILCNAALPAQVAPTSTVAPAVAQTPTATAQVSAAVEQLRQTIPALRLEKWRVKGPVREEASTNLDSIRRDLDGTLPGLLAQADAAPNSVSKSLPVYRNLVALYDVLLRVVDSARLTAPADDAAALEDSLHSLEGALRTLGDTIQTSSVLTENQLAATEAKLHAVRSQAPSAPAGAQVVDDGTAPPPPAVHHHRRKPRPKPVTPPADAPAAPPASAPQKQ